MADLGLMTDLLPTVAALFCGRRIQDVRLSYMQAAGLIALGGQRRSADNLAREFNVPATQLLALLNKAMAKISSAFQKMLEQEAKDAVPEAKGAVGDASGLAAMTLRQEQRAAAGPVLAKQKADLDKLQGYAVANDDESEGRSLKRPNGTQSTSPEKKKKKKKHSG